MYNYLRERTAHAHTARQARLHTTFRVSRWTHKLHQQAVK